MGTDSSGLPWCEPGTHDHEVLGFTFQLPEVSDLASFSMLLSAFGGPGRRKGKSIPVQFRTTTLVWKSSYSQNSTLRSAIITRER